MLRWAHLAQPLVSVSESRFVGRAALLEGVTSRLRGGQSVVLLGPPGVGKSRIALESVRNLTDEVSLIVELTDVRSRGDFVSRVADALQIWRSPATDADDLQTRVKRSLSSHGPAVFVLDNFEQLPEEADALLGSWMECSPVVFLVTTRRRLALSAGHLEVGPLDTVDRGAGPWSDAAALVRSRAAEIAKVSLDEDDRAAAHLLAALLDGSPLALELAAARLSLLTPKQLIERLEKQFDVLDSDSRGLTAALQTSYGLLDAAARSLLIACSVFSGSIALEALEVVANPALAEAQSNTLAALATLRDHSLVRVERHGDRYRYRLANAVRRFVREREMGGAIYEAACRRHAEHYAAPRDTPVDVADVENLQAAFDWAAARDLELAAKLALALSAPALGLSYKAAGAAVSRVFEGGPLPERPDTERLVAELLFRRGTVLRFTSDYAGAVSDLERALTSAQRLGDDGLVADVLAGLGNAMSGQADWERARHYLSRALSAQALAPGRALTLAMIANTHSNEDAYDKAEPLLREAIAIAEAHQDAFAEAFARLSLGILLVERSAFDEAFANLVDSLSIFETSRSTRVMQARHLRAVALTHMARVRQETGDTARALSDYHEALAYAEETGVRRAEAFALYGLASLLLELGELRAADDRIRAGLPLLRENAKDVEGAMVALQGVLFALRGAHADAERFFRRAEALLAAHKRPVFTVALSALRGRETAGSPFDDFADVRLARRLRALFTETRESAPLLVADDAAFFRSPDAEEQVSLARRKSVRGVLRALVMARLSRPGIPLSIEALVLAGWPGEKILASAGAERVYAAIATLRRLGLRGFIAQESDGYLIRADRPVLVHEAAQEPT